MDWELVVGERDPSNLASSVDQAHQAEANKEGNTSKALPKQ